VERYLLNLRGLVTDLARDYNHYYWPLIWRRSESSDRGGSIGDRYQQFLEDDGRWNTQQLTVGRPAWRDDHQYV
jgi:hypothetical protein